MAYLTKETIENFDAVVIETKEGFQIETTSSNWASSTIIPRTYSTKSYANKKLKEYKNDIINAYK